MEDQSAPIPREITSKLGGSRSVVRCAQSKATQPHPLKVWKIRMLNCLRVVSVGPVADQPVRPRTPPGVGGEGWPVSLLCSRNARGLVCLVGRSFWSVWFLWMNFQSDQPNKPNRPDRPDEPAFVGRAQSETNQAIPCNSSRRKIKADGRPDRRHPRSRWRP